MTKFTNKQLTDQAREEVDFWRERDELIPSQQTAIRLRLAEIAMAALMTPEPEPVADVVAWSSPSEERTCDIRWRRHDVKPGPLYTAPPAPVLIDERAAFNAWNNDENLPIAGVGAKNAAWLAWQARAAMLQGAEPTNQRDELPMQPLVMDAHGTLRFKENPIVRKLLDYAAEPGYGLNEIARAQFDAEDQMQLAQLIGYSLSGYGTLSYVTDKSYDRAAATAPQQEDPQIKK
ncbi:hypothetical protein [Leclercia adecarboxylata]|uniref:hypothetical protein n=1 Tax=Leclercia adecarboxylata TaxID=83655 RepID=UPI001CEF6B6B|nr:hypothetical protein [Leclercia adecarboxylata]